MVQDVDNLVPLNWYIIDVHVCVYTTCAIMADNLINGHILFIWLMDGFVLLDAPIIDLYHFSHELLITIILMLWPIHWYTFLILDHVLINCLIYTSLSEQWFGKHDDWSIIARDISYSPQHTWPFPLVLRCIRKSSRLRLSKNRNNRTTRNGNFTPDPSSNDLFPYDFRGCLTLQHSRRALDRILCFVPSVTSL